MAVSEESRLETVNGWRRVIGFTLPSIAMMVFISSYTVVDGAFISNYVDTDALASLNIMMPAYTLLSGMGFMLASGGSAYVANLLGRKEPDRARAAFTQIVLTAVIISLALSVIGYIFMEPMARLLGADDLLVDGCVRYTGVYLFFTVFLVLQFVTNQFLVVSGKPVIALFLSISGGVANIVLDYLFIVVFGWGLEGAAAASGIGSLIPGGIALLIFADRRMTVHFTRPASGADAIVSSCTNGFSEMVSEISGGVTTLCYNLVMMHYIGADGVAAISILAYVQFLALSAIIGYSNGIAPVMSYRHGAGDRPRMQGLFKVSATFILILSVSAFVIMELFADGIAGLFADSSENVMNLTVRGAKIFAFGFLFMGINVYASSMYTSLSNGKVSALISFIRTLAVLAPLIVLLPAAFGIDAVWYAVPVTELCTFLLVLFFFVRLDGRYGYLGVSRE